MQRLPCLGDCYTLRQNLEIVTVTLLSCVSLFIVYNGFASFELCWSFVTVREGRHADSLLCFLIAILMALLLYAVEFCNYFKLLLSKEVVFPHP